MIHKQSKFIWDAHNMKLVEGKLPNRDNQCWKGEDLNGAKVEIAYCYTGSEDNPYVCYWGWS